MRGAYFVFRALCRSKRQAIHGTAISVAAHKASARCPLRGIVGCKSGSRRAAGNGRSGTGMILACAGSAGTRALYSSTLTMGEFPHARLDGSCGTRRKTNASISSASNASNGEARRAGCKIVLVTGALDFTMAPLARHLGADDVIANKMQFVGGVATGRVIPPIIEGANKANRVREYCVRHGLRLDLSHAYSDSLSDYPMLTVVGRP